MPRTMWRAQTNLYGGRLQFPAVADNQLGQAYPPISIPLYMRDQPIPGRQHQIQEIGGMGESQEYLPNFNYSARFFGVQTPLTITLTGWLITPMTNGIWRPTDNGEKATVPGTTDMGLPNHSYADIICAYIDGRMSIDADGRLKRVDPSAFIDTYGNIYLAPKIQAYDFAYTPTPKKQTFNMTLWLEATYNS